MKTSLIAALLPVVLAVPASAESMRVFPNGSRPSLKGPDATFTGSVRVDPSFAAPDSRVSAGYVTFEPGARSAWHTHPAGQVLIVTAGTGWVQEAGAARREIGPGDVVWTPPGVKR